MPLIEELKTDHRLHGLGIGVLSWYLLKGKVEPTPQIGLSIGAGYLTYHMMVQKEQNDRHSDRSPHHDTPSRTAFKTRGDGEHRRWHQRSYFDQLTGNIPGKTRPKWTDKDPAWSPWMSV